MMKECEQHADCCCNGSRSNGARFFCLFFCRLFFSCMETRESHMHHDGVFWDFFVHITAAYQIHRLPLLEMYIWAELDWMGFSFIGEAYGTLIFSNLMTRHFPSRIIGLGDEWGIHWVNPSACREKAWGDICIVHGKLDVSYIGS